VSPAHRQLSCHCPAVVMVHSHCRRSCSHHCAQWYGASL